MYAGGFDLVAKASEGIKNSASLQTQRLDRQRHPLAIYPDRLVRQYAPNESAAYALLSLCEPDALHSQARVRATARATARLRARARTRTRCINPKPTLNPYPITRRAGVPRPTSTTTPSTTGRPSQARRAVPWRYLPYISPISPLYLPYISPGAEPRDAPEIVPDGGATERRRRAGGEQASGRG